MVQLADVVPRGTDSGHSWAADGGPAGGDAQALLFPGSRAGYRSAQDLVVIPSFSQGAQGAADGGAVGGSPDCRVFFSSL